MLPFSRFEARTILKLSGPIVIAQLTQTLMYFVDTVMAGRYSAVDMAAIAVASGLWLPVILTLQGLILALTPIVAQHYGNNQHKPVTHFTVQAMYLAMALAAALFVVMLFVQYPIDLLQMEAELRQKSLDYLYYVSFGLLPAAGYMVMRSFFEGIGNTKASMWISFVGILVNIPANYIFIYGKLGMPAMGGAGCGVATALVFTAMFIAVMIYAWLNKAARKYRQHPASYKVNLKDCWQIITIGTPIAFSLFFEVTLFACIPLAIVHLGPVMVAGHQISQNFSGIIFMLPLSLGMATTIRVGHLVGQKNLKELKKSISTAVVLAMTMSFVIASLTFLFRHKIAGLYSPDPTVIALASSLLILACFYQLSDAIQVVSACALRGLKHTKPVFYITLVSYWPIGFGLGAILGLTDWIVPAMGPHGFWLGIIAGLSVAAALMAYTLIKTIKRLENEGIAIATSAN
ncbi:MATE family efflux transporter [Rheinheimera sp. MMS21-TC3]|uniref:MATE family efflux transporter n=1 Tax=Rheinheimera sp. MMS21-TC3 TaxID=3072790 RepID=UPI0028C4ADF8|nr:MATE family efflux transporter [Rheinheimera sp. MMS21-TC3]WNO60657.1 MATE family efflux transporter [Rheinheimera sp. MMS21-TC3]